MGKGLFFPYRDENKAKKFPHINLLLIVVTVLIFFWSLPNFEYIIGTYGFTPSNFVILTIFTSMFLHAGLDHLFGNMWYLFIFGDNVEDRFGIFKYTLFYFASGIAATLAHYLSDPSSVIPAIGASGAISGVLGAYVVFFPHVKVHVLSRIYHGTVPAWVMIGFWFVLQLILGTTGLISGQGSGIAFWAHIGGFAFGAVAAWVYKTFTE